MPARASRRQMLQFAASASLASLWPHAAHAQARQFTPQPGAWRSFELTTTVAIAQPDGATRVWLPVPAIDGPFQRSLTSSWRSNAASARIVSAANGDARMLVAEFAADGPPPHFELVSRVQTQSRGTDWQAAPRPVPEAHDPELRRIWTAPTEMIPTDGIVRETAERILAQASNPATDEAKARALYDWTVVATHREPKVRGCGVGDIKAMLETENFGGKCADINALYVGLCRAVGVPARDVYGIRVAPSAFGYRELGGNPAKLQAAQHCRAEVWLAKRGWVATDPADVGKVMRQETAEWIKDPAHPIVQPVRQALFGGWEGNWLGFNSAHDVQLPGSDGPALAFFMYPQAENAQGRLDPLDPDNFRYTITAKELAA